MLLRKNPRQRFVAVFSLMVIVLAFTTTTPAASAAEPAEQVIFSGIGFTNDGLLKVGFWIWCTPEGNSPIYTGACRGSVLIYGEDSAVGVAGFIVENPDGTYVARVFSIKATSFLVAAVFHNVAPEPAQGPSNLVQFGVLTPLGNSVGVSTDAVVNVTGPGD